MQFNRQALFGILILQQLRESWMGRDYVISNEKQSDWNYKADHT